MQSSVPLAALPQINADRAIRVMIVDDSVVVRGLLSRWLNDDPEITVVSSQSNGTAALRDLDNSRPDVVLLDVEMPVMDGITALPLMLERRKDLVVIMASGLTQHNAEITLRALSLGASDYIPKPEGNHSLTTSVDFRRGLIEKVKALATAAQGKLSLARHGQARDAAELGAFQLRPFSRVRPRILAMGASTGGPQILYSMFSVIGPHIDQVPVLITQHMPKNFTAILTEQIGKKSGRPASEGQHGEILRPGHIYIAPGGTHMLVEGDGDLAKIVISDSPAVHFCKPAVDPLFESVARVFGAAALALVLTGMGSDGAGGGLKIADTGGSVIAQDEATSVVWGMPGAAARLGACAAILPIDELNRKVASILGRGSC